jgi:hypothetical protein
MAWCKRVRSDFHLDKDEDGEKRQGYAGEGNDISIRPRYVAASIETNEQAEDGSYKDKCAEEVDTAKFVLPMRVFFLREVKNTIHHCTRQNSKRELSDESPTSVSKVADIILKRGIPSPSNSVTQESP